MEVNIFINIYHTGHLKKGTGTYAITLEYIKKSGEPETRLSYGGYTDTTKNRTALHAILVALERLKKPCLVNIHINVPYVTEPFSQGWIQHWDIETWTKKGKPIPNAELWKPILEQTRIHRIQFFNAPINPYTLYMESEMKRNKFEYKEDTHV